MDRVTQEDEQREKSDRGRDQEGEMYMEQQEDKRKPIMETGR